MKAPDKIYVDDLAVVNDCVTKVSAKPLSNFSEYIRKDYLLEWLKDMKFMAKSERVGAYQNVIDKLNKM